MSKPKPPERYKAIEDYTADEHARRKRHGERAETPEYRAYVRDVHDVAGLDLPDGYDDEKSLEEMSTAEHFARMTGRRLG